MNQLNNQSSQISSKNSQKSVLTFYGLIVILEAFTALGIEFITKNIFYLFLMVNFLIIILIGFKIIEKWKIHLFTGLTILNLFFSLFLFYRFFLSGFFEGFFGPQDIPILIIPLLTFPAVLLYIVFTIYLWFKFLSINKQNKN